MFGVGTAFTPSPAREGGEEVTVIRIAPPEPSSHLSFQSKSDLSDFDPCGEVGRPDFCTGRRERSAPPKTASLVKVCACSSPSGVRRAQSALLRRSALPMDCALLGRADGAIKRLRPTVHSEEAARRRVRAPWWAPWIAALRAGEQGPRSRPASGPTDQLWFGVAVDPLFKQAFKARQIHFLLEKSRRSFSSSI